MPENLLDFELVDSGESIMSAISTIQQLRIAAMGFAVSASQNYEIKDTDKLLETAEEIFMFLADGHRPKIKVEE